MRSASAAICYHQRLVDQQGKQIQDLVPLHISTTGDRLGCLQIEAAKKHGQAAKQHPFGLSQ